MFINKSIFLDRDGIINNPIIKNNKPFSPRSTNEFYFTNGIYDLLNFFVTRGYLLFIVSNQPDISNGLLTWIDLFAINKIIYNNLPQIKSISYCHHDKSQNCECRKPKPYFIERYKFLYDIDLSKSWVIGDRWSDIEMGKNAECKTIFIDYKYDEKQPDGEDYRVNNIQEIYDIFKKENND